MQLSSKSIKKSKALELVQSRMSSPSSSSSVLEVTALMSMLRSQEKDHRETITKTVSGKTTRKSIKSLLSECKKDETFDPRVFFEISSRFS